MPGGRPRKFESVEKMQLAIDKYFDDCEGTMLADKETGEPVLNKYDEPIFIGAKPPTVTGLALALGFTSRQDLINYNNIEEFHDTITRAKLKCQNYAETRLYDRDGANGAKFSLQNNFGWKDIQQIEQTGPNGGPIELSNVSKLTDDALRRVIEIMEQGQNLLTD